MKHDKFTPHYIIMKIAIEKFRVEKTHFRWMNDFDSALEINNKLLKNDKNYFE